MAVRYYLPMFTGCVHCCCSQLTFNAFPLHWSQAAKRVVLLNEHLNGTTTATTVASQFTVKLSERETPIDTSIYRHFLLSQLLMSKAWDIYFLWFLNPIFFGSFNFRHRCRKCANEDVKEVSVVNRANPLSSVPKRKVILMIDELAVAHVITVCSFFVTNFSIFESQLTHLLISFWPCRSTFLFYY